MKLPSFFFVAIFTQPYCFLINGLGLGPAKVRLAENLSFGVGSFAAWQHFFQRGSN